MTKSIVAVLLLLPLCAGAPLLFLRSASGVGETPYAEGAGDSANLSLSPQDRLVIDRMNAAGLRVVLAVVSGRPLVLNDAVREKVDAIVAAWLPGTEGAGVADVLFGDYKPSGELSFA